MFIVKQLQVGGYDNNFSYVIIDKETQETAIVDPCGDTQIIKKSLPENYLPKYLLLTHSHHDHISGIKDVKIFFNAPVANYHKSSYPMDLPLKDHDYLPLGNAYIECIHTPGHTDDSMVFRLSDDSGIFTGDTLFIDYCGFCKPKPMFNSLHNCIFPLKDTNIVYSGHNYGHVPFASLAEEKLTNKYLAAQDFKTFEKVLMNLN
jgi:glyoxylase-like metal-dependent hydrolase (beta-lactamase superfamily II)